MRTIGVFVCVCPSDEAYREKGGQEEPLHRVGLFDGIAVLPYVGSVGTRRDLGPPFPSRHLNQIAAKEYYQIFLAYPPIASRRHMVCVLSQAPSVTPQRSCSSTLPATLTSTWTRVGS
uniref:Uncharacterized protein n=1 Tax=Amorphochlora amoebiformis TaxID=1561963 RepID=A0A7S0DFI3_9EUKA